jgi:hypothetical protein
MHRLYFLAPVAALALAACGDAPTAAGNPADAAQLSPTETAAANGEANGAASTSFIRRSGDYYCTSSVRGSFENVIVPEGRTCTLTASTVSGNILAKDGARVYVYETTTQGNIDGVEADLVHVRAGTIEGSIQVQDGNNRSLAGVRIYGGTILTQGNITVQKMNTGTISIVDAVLRKGNIQVQDNSTATRLEILRNRVAQNLQVFVNLGNTAKLVRNNTVGSVLSCKDNQLPFTGRPNVAGDVEGQCGR